MSGIPEVLFVCVHSAGRSQAAAALLDHHIAGRERVRSAGSAPGTEINPSVRAILEERGLYIPKEFPKRLTKDAAQAADVIVTRAAATSARSFPASATSTGSSMIRPARTSTKYDQSSTTSTADYPNSSQNWASPEALTK